MTLREDLERVQKLIVAGDKSGDYTKASIYALNFVGEHGQALVEAVTQQEYDRSSLVNLIAEASVARLALAHCAENGEMYQSAYDRLSKAIDQARGKAIDAAMNAEK